MKTTQDVNTWEITTTFSSEDEKEMLFNLIRVHINLMPKAYRKYNHNWGIVQQLTGHGSGYSESICKAFGVDPLGYEWKSQEEKMKKKIGDLTLREAKKFCDKQYACLYCPLKGRGLVDDTFIHCKIDVTDTEFDSEYEIEVEEDDIKRVL